MKLSGHGGKSLALNPFKGRLTLNDEGDDDGEDTSTASSSIHQVPISETASVTNHASNEPIKMKTGSKVTFMQPTSSSKRSKEIPRRMAFELSLDGATLLCRRKKALGTVEV